jgi:hypothetical protein
MYKQIKTKEKITLDNGVEVTPVATLADEYGGDAHIWIDNGCYVFGLERKISKVIHNTYTYSYDAKVIVKKSHYIFHELFEVLKTLPSPLFYKHNTDVEELGTKILYRPDSSRRWELKEGILKSQVINEKGSFVKIDDKWYNKDSIEILAKNI